MTCQEFLTLMKSHGGIIAPGASNNEIILANTTLQNMRGAMLPPVMQQLYNAASAINLGNGYIFGPNEITHRKSFPIPSITKINSDIAQISAMRGKTVFGRNDLFWFAFDAMGKFYMLDNLTLKPLRQYDDAFRAMTDCLVAGKI